MLAATYDSRTCSEVEREIVLGQLVDYLGHTNTVIYGAAFNEVRSAVYVKIIVDGDSCCHFRSTSKHRL